MANARHFSSQILFLQFYCWFLFKCREKIAITMSQFASLTICWAHKAVEFWRTEENESLIFIRAEINNNNCLFSPFHRSWLLTSLKCYSLLILSSASSHRSIHYRQWHSHSSTIHMHCIVHDSCIYRFEFWIISISLFCSCVIMRSFEVRLSFRILLVEVLLQIILLGWTFKCNSEP